MESSDQNGREQGEQRRIAADLVLLVDDEVHILAEFQELLESAGYKAVTESDAELALERLLADPAIGVVITDLRMPRLSGDQLIVRARERLPEGRRVEFMVVTGNPISQACIKDLGIPVLEKPIDFDELFAALDAALARVA